MIVKNYYVAPALEEVCDVPAAVLCESPDFTSPSYDGQEDEFIF